jgi:glycosyltransferase involved in cell wall biosynthesis
LASPLRVLYVFTARKGELLAQAARGEAPDTLLFGYNHLEGTGIAPAFYEPEYPPLGRVIARQAGRFGPDLLQLRTLRHFPAYDAVFLTGGWPLLLAARAIPRARRPKLIWLNMTLTNLLRRPRPLTRLLRAAVGGADRVVCVARHQQTFLQRLYGWGPGRTPLARSGTDARFYAPERARPPAAPAAGPAGQPLGADVLAPGRDAGRDYATLLAALEGPGDGPRLRLVCSPANLAGLALPPRASVRYDLPPAALRDEYGAARCVAIPTHGDGSTAGSDCSGTLVLLDALAMGRPAVISQRASVADYVTAGAEVLTVPPGEPAPLRAAIDRLLADAPEAARLAAAGRERVLAALTTRHFAGRIAEVLHETV